MENIPGRVFYNLDGKTIKDPFHTLADAGINVIRVEGQRGQCLGPTKFVNDKTTLGKELVFGLDWGCLDVQVKTAQRGAALGMRIVLTINQGLNIPSGMESYTYAQMVAEVQKEARRQLQPFLAAKILPDVILLENEGSDGFLFHDNSTGHDRGVKSSKISAEQINKELCGQIPTGNMASYPQYAGYLKAEILACNEAISAAGLSTETVRYGLHSHAQYVQWKEGVVHGPNPPSESALKDSAGNTCSAQVIPKDILAHNASTMMTIAGFSAYPDPMTPTDIDSETAMEAMLERPVKTLEQLQSYAQAYGKYEQGPFKGQYKLQGLGVEWATRYAGNQIPQEVAMTEMMWKKVKAFDAFLGVMWWEPWYCYNDWEGGDAAMCRKFATGAEGTGEAPTELLRTWGAAASGFTALNIAYEEESEEEVDDSRELQIEEALKLYQNALKLHSRGPAFYAEAEKAYKEIFRSEIFTYLESLSETQWLEKYGEAAAPEEAVEADLTAELPALTAGGDGGPSTLPHILYLAYKNYGQFRLDCIKQQLDDLETSLRPEPLSKGRPSIESTASAGLLDLAEALDRDEGDLELWRKVARVGEFLGSRRIARYCLETVLDTGGVDPATEIEPLSIEEILANEQIQPLLVSIDRHMADAVHPHLPGNSHPLSNYLRKHIDPCPYLPEKAQHALAGIFHADPKIQEIQVPFRNWASCGKVILFNQSQEKQGLGLLPLGARFNLHVPVSKSNGASPTTNGHNTDKTPRLRHITDVERPDIPQNDGANDPVENREQSAAIHEEPTEESKSLNKTDLDLRDSSAKPATSPQARIANALEPRLANRDEEAQEDGENQVAAAPTMVLPSRKRSSDTAELPDGPEGVRVRSKRIKARGSLAESASLKDTIPEDWSKWYKQQLDIYVQADIAAFASAKSWLLQIGCDVPDYIVDNEAAVQDDAPDSVSTLARHDVVRVILAQQDLSELLDQWDYPKSKLLLTGDGLQKPSANTNTLSNASFSSFLAQSTALPENVVQRDTIPESIELAQFVKTINEHDYTSLGEIAYQWTRKLLGQQSLGTEAPEGPYEAYRWPDDLKQTMVQMLVHHDAFIFTRVQELVERSVHQERADIDSSSLATLVNLVQIIFELHLDVYGRITNPSSQVDAITRKVQCDRLSRWALLANTALSQLDSNPSSVSIYDSLRYRFLWASVVNHSLLEPSMLETTVMYYQDLIRQMKSEAEDSQKVAPIILLPNNAIMPEVSVGAAEREISRLTTLDFFKSIFSASDDDPMAVVDSLGPLLTLSMMPHDQPRQAADNRPLAQENRHREDEKKASPDFIKTLDHRLSEALQYLSNSAISLKLFLWQRLQDAYSIINYPPEILSCNLWCFILIVNHLESDEYSKGSAAKRGESLLRWLHNLDDIMTQVLALSSTDPAAFDSVDFDQVCSALHCLAILQRVVHSFATWEDTIRVGQTQPTPQASSAATKAQLKSAEKMRDMIVKTWTLQYVLIKEASKQKGDLRASEGDLIHYLRSSHEALGLRTYCGLANRTFLKLIKSELLQMTDNEEWRTEMPQVIFDLYGIKITSNPGDIQDHSCEATELDKSTALQLLDLVMVHVNRLSVKEILKNDLKFAVDKMQQVIRVPKASSSTSARTFNKRLINNYLKSPIQPVELYRSLRGVGELCSTPARTDGWSVAAKGWYFLIGQLYLVKFRSQKRTAAGSLDDLEAAKAMFKQDLEFDTERWESWYRLAQTYDTQIDESVTWSAEKIQNDSSNLIDLQRKAILSYAMAVSVARRDEDPSFESAEKIACLYAEFGFRIYSSTREPFSMKVFGLSDFKRQFNGAQRGMYEGLPFKPLHLYGAWKLASALLTQAARQKAQDWSVSYMLGKVLWKMYSCSEEVRSYVKRIDYRLVLDALIQAIEAIPGKRDSRHSDKDPILEPHYKLVTVVHKLVRSGDLKLDEAFKVLDVTPYSRKVPTIQDLDDWEPYILAVLKALRSADKSNWHHRMVVKAAHIIYNENPEDSLAMLGAKHELSHHIFTKSMTIQVWKPDNERPGRHFVYTGRYVRFFVELLFKLREKDNLEMLARRIRKKGSDFVDHSSIWHDVSWAYLNLLRTSIPVPTDYEEAVFKNMSLEEFHPNAQRLETWAQNASSELPHIDALRDAIDFKRLNNNLLKTSSVEDLIADIYAHIYNTNVPGLKAKDIAEENRVRMSVDNILTISSPATRSNDGTPPAANNEVSNPSNPGQESHGPGRRKSTIVSRREIIRRAESLVVRAPPAAPKPAPRALAPAPESSKTPGIAVIISKIATPNNVGLRPSSRGLDDGGAPSELLSVAGSIHDDADDESELSEVEGSMEEPNDENMNAEDEGEEDGEEEREADGEKGDDGDDEDEDEENEAPPRATMNSEKRRASQLLFPNLLNMKSAATNERDTDAESGHTFGREDEVEEYAKSKSQGDDNDDEEEEQEEQDEQEEIEDNMEVGDEDEAQVKVADEDVLEDEDQDQAEDLVDDGDEDVGEDEEPEEGEEEEPEEGEEEMEEEVEVEEEEPEEEEDEVELLQEQADEQEQDDEELDEDDIEADTTAPHVRSRAPRSHDEPHEEEEEQESE